MEEKTLKVLLLEDSQDDAALIERILHLDNLDCVTERVDSREEFDHALKNFKPDVVLCDHGLPAFNSREALKMSLREKVSVPFILVTGTMSDELAISILKEGADDYILKSNLLRLPVAIRRSIKQHKLERLKREARHALRKHNEELLKAKQELDNFAYHVSHNLRSPLASILGLINISKNIGKDQQLTDVHAMILTSALKMEETLHDIVEHAKNSRNEVASENIDWGFLIDKVVKKTEYLDPDNNVYKTMQLHTKKPFVNDSARLFSILTHVFSNAILYRSKSHADFLRLEIRTTAKHAVIKVIDNGIGIHPDVLPKIGGMFYRGTELSHGTGLGLYVVKEIIGRLNGKLDIESEYRKGSVITITLPNRTESDRAEN